MKRETLRQIDRLFDKSSVGLAVFCAVSAIYSRLGLLPEWHEIYYRSFFEHFTSGFAAPLVPMLLIGTLLFFKCKRPPLFLQSPRTIIGRLSESQKDIWLLGLSAAAYVVLSACWETYQYIAERNCGLFQFDQLMCDIAGATLWSLILGVRVSSRYHADSDLAG